MSRRIAAFIDRDGTICYDRHYLADPTGLELIPTVSEGIRKLNEAGILVIVVTNQSGIARRKFDEERLDEIHARLRDLLYREGAKIDDMFYCPHMPNAGCKCRKPAPGMLIEATRKYNIDLKGSFVIGDRMMDVEMANRVGARAVLVPEPGDQYDIASEMGCSKERPAYRANTFAEAVEWIQDQIRAKTCDE